MSITMSMIFRSDGNCINDRSSWSIGNCINDLSISKRNGWSFSHRGRSRNVADLLID